MSTLLNSGILTNEFIFATLLSACARLKDVEFGRLMHCYVVKTGLEASSFCEGALIDMYSKRNLVTDARQVFDGSKDLDTVSWTSMIAGYSQDGLLEEALKMPNPNVVAWNVMISRHTKRGNENAMLGGYAQNGYADEIIELFSQMKGSGFNPDEFTYTSILSACACFLETGSALVDMNAKCGAIEDARVFSTYSLPKENMIY
ncbi:hypothetical protein DITRI_Ditri03aG0140700 [Diplodiscus trichospermus]